MSVDARRKAPSRWGFARPAETGLEKRSERHVADPNAHHTDALTTSEQALALPGGLSARAMGAPTSLSRFDVTQLQRLVGNRAVVQLLQQRPQASSSVQRLPVQLESTMGTLFGGAPEAVHVHTGPRGDRAARAANTDAVTVGNDIFFREGSYRPGTSAGNAVIAREMAHLQRSKLVGSRSSTPSTDASGAAKQDATQVGEIVGELGADPTQTLQPVRGRPTATQQRLIQRDDGKDEVTSTAPSQPLPTTNKYSHGRSAGIVTSKVLQGIFTTVLGPVGLLWRGPLIQKNLAEITGWDQFGSRKGKAGKSDKGEAIIVDRQRYGNTGLGTVMRWMAGISELLKEFTIWLGFGTFIAAIVAAATHGALAPVAAGLGIATAVVAGVHAVLRTLLVALNGYRLWRAEEAGNKAKIPFIKHQMVNDGLEGIGAAISAVLGGLSGAGLSAGGALAKEAHVATPSQALAGFGLGMGTISSPLSGPLTAAKEAGKEAVKPGAEKGFGGGFWKDWGDIKAAKEGIGEFGFRRKPKSTPPQQPSADSQLPVGSEVGPASGLPPEGVEVLKKTDDVLKQSGKNVSQQSIESGASKKQTAVVSDVGSSLGDSGDKTRGLTNELSATAKAAKDQDKSLDSNVDKTVGDSTDVAKSLGKQVGQALKMPDPSETSSPSDDAAVIAQIEQNQGGSTGPSNVSEEGKEPGGVKTRVQMQAVQRKGGFGRAADWLASKLGGIKAGVRRLNAKIVAGVLKYAGKLDKSEADHNASIATIVEEKAFVDKYVQEESENDRLFTAFQDKAAQLKTGATALAEKAK